MHFISKICSVFKKKEDPVKSIKFKEVSEKRLAKEFQQLKIKNIDLYNILVDLAEYVKSNFSQDVVITMIYRTREEQVSIYGKDTKKVSPHTLWMGVDIRSRVFSSEQIAQIVDYLNTKYDEKSYFDWTSKCHEVNNCGEHFHIQFISKT